MFNNDNQKPKIIKNAIVAISVLFFVFPGVHYIIFVEDNQKLIQVFVALGWGAAFHFAALKFIPKSYIFSNRNKLREEKSNPSA